MRGSSILAVSIGFLLCWTSLSPAADVKTVTVDCAKGDSINKALATKADELIVEISGDAFGVVAQTGTQLLVRGASSISASPFLDSGFPSGAAVSAHSDSFVVLFGPALEGPVLLNASQVRGEIGTTQTTSAAWAGSGNDLQLDSILRLRQGSAFGTVARVRDFSKVVILDTSVVNGDLNGESGSDAYCDDPSTNVTGASNCGHCASP